MIITLIFVALIVVTLLVLWIMKHKNNYSDALITIDGGFLIIGIIGFIVCITLIILVHSAARTDLHNNIELRNSLVRRCEVIESEYEDVSKSDLIKDITKFNNDLYSYKYYQSNPWTNWFYVEEIANTLDYVEYPD